MSIHEPHEGAAYHRKTREAADGPFRARIEVLVCAECNHEVPVQYPSLRHLAVIDCSLTRLYDSQGNLPCPGCGVIWRDSSRRFARTVLDTPAVPRTSHEGDRAELAHDAPMALGEPSRAWYARRHEEVQGRAKPDDLDRHSIRWADLDTLRPRAVFDERTQAPRIVLPGVDQERPGDAHMTFEECVKWRAILNREHRNFPEEYRQQRKLASIAAEKVQVTTANLGLPEPVRLLAARVLKQVTAGVSLAALVEWRSTYPLDTRERVQHAHGASILGEDKRTARRQSRTHAVESLAQEGHHAPIRPRPRQGGTAHAFQARLATFESRNREWKRRLAARTATLQDAFREDLAMAQASDNRMARAARVSRKRARTEESALALAVVALVLDKLGCQEHEDALRLRAWDHTVGRQKWPHALERLAPFVERAIARQNLEPATRALAKRRRSRAQKARRKDSTRHVRAPGQPRTRQR